MGCGSLLHVLGSIAVRFAIPLLVALTAVALADREAGRLRVRAATVVRLPVPGADDRVVAGILVFGDGNKQQVFLSSADWMPRNFDRRVEVMFPIESEDLRRRIVDELIPTYLGDNLRTRVLRSDGTYARATPGDGRSTSLPCVHHCPRSAKGSHRPAMGLRWPGPRGSTPGA